MEKINVEMGGFEIAKSPIMLQTIGIGSCVIVCLYNKVNKIGGLAHIMLPSSKIEKKGINPFRFADKAIDAAVNEMKKKGCNVFTAKIFGGAAMFEGITDIVQIGVRNIEAVENILKRLKIKITAKDVGGNQGRSVWFDTVDGSVVVSHTHGETVEM